MDPLELVKRLHATPHRVVLEFAGAGSQALAWLHAVGGSSRTILEATDRYASASLESALRFEPERATSRRVAEGLAAHAADRAAELLRLDGLDYPSFGLGSTATIATDRTKKGEHRVVVAVKDPFGVSSWEVVLAKGERDRSGEEGVVSRLILRAAAEASGIMGPYEAGLRDDEPMTPSFTPSKPLAAIEGGRRRTVRLEPTGDWSDAPGDAHAILSGSFHPIHAGHRELRRAAATHLDVPTSEVAYELPVKNADKGGLGPRETRRRASQFLGYAPLILSDEPLFAGKAALYPNCVFVVGFDTAARVVDLRFYDGEAGMRAALDAIRGHGCRFLVAGRAVNGKPNASFLTLGDLVLPDGYEDLFEALPAESFRKDISSRRIRSTWGEGEH